MLRLKTEAEAAHEHMLYDWMVEQWLMHDAGLLSWSTVAELNNISADWSDHYSAADAAHAFNCENRELRAAVELWWNTLGLRGAPLTFEEIHLMAALEA